MCFCTIGIEYFRKGESTHETEITDHDVNRSIFSTLIILITPWKVCHVETVPGGGGGIQDLDNEGALNF